MMDFFILGPAYPKHKVGNGRDEAEKWSELIIAQTRDLPKVKGPCEMKIVYQLPPDRFSVGSPFGPDLDNLTKRLLDSLSSTILMDVDSKDGCICKIEISKTVALSQNEVGTHVIVKSIRELDLDGRFLYFAYGSNMHFGRLQERVKSLKKESVALLPGYKLRMNKRGDDGSGKANIEPSGSMTDVVWGIVWSITNSDRYELHEAEAYRPNRHDSHYKPIDVIIFDETGMSWKAMTYVACEDRKSAADLPLYSWYYEYLIRGAKYYGLPREYLKIIEKIEKIDDPDCERTKKNMIIAEKWH